MIYFNNKKKIDELKQKINKDNIYVFMDYDKTITSSKCEDSWATTANKKAMGKAISNDLNKFYEKYGPIELDYTIDIQEKEKYMLEWYEKSMNLYYTYHLTKEKLKECIYNSHLELREGAKDFLNKLYNRNIPVIIFSAGIGNVIEQFLKEKECYYDNITIIGNFIKFDKNGDMIKFSDNIIHTLNKNIDKLNDDKLKEKIEEKEYRIVIGDLVEDINMMGEYPEDKSLKIGFLNKNVAENLEVYRKNFDIVLTEENNFFDIEKCMSLDNKDEKRE